eukprot:5129149-Amphidinium_carterae.1
MQKGIISGYVMQKEWQKEYQRTAKGGIVKEMYAIKAREPMKTDGTRMEFHSSSPPLRSLIYHKNSKVNDY